MPERDADNELLLAESAAPGLECGTCTACCTIMAVTELNKPARWACPHVASAGCGIYAARPESCRAFNCVWLRGAIGDDESLRPDRLGVLFDCFVSATTGKIRSVAFELWTGAFTEPRAARAIARVAADRELELSYRDGTWRTIGPDSPACVVPAPVAE
jgi:Fe-S-cluster containining protein